MTDPGPDKARCLFVCLLADLLFEPIVKIEVSQKSSVPGFLERKNLIIRWSWALITEW